MSELTHEEKREELEAAGYNILIEHFDGMTYSHFLSRALASNGVWLEGEAHYYRKKNERDEANRLALNSLIDKAWEHYQREKKFKAMEALLGEMWHGYVDSAPDYAVHPVKEFEDWVRRVGKLLGKYEGE